MTATETPSRAIHIPTKIISGATFRAWLVPDEHPHLLFLFLIFFRGDVSIDGFHIVGDGL